MQAQGAGRTYLRRTDRIRQWAAVITVSKTNNSLLYYSSRSVQDRVARKKEEFEAGLSPCQVGNNTPVLCCTLLHCPAAADAAAISAGRQLLAAVAPLPHHRPRPPRRRDRDGLRP